METILAKKRGKHSLPHPRMNSSTFQEQVRQYSHLPDVFLKELAKVADRISEEKRAEIIAELDSSAERELQILSDGYKVIADAEKKVRHEVETQDRADDVSKADAVLSL